MKRLKAKEVKAFRLQQLEKQGGICPLCLRVILDSEAVLDHDHKSGYCRGTLHRGCNSFLGKVENARIRYGLYETEAFKAFLSNVYEYIDSNLDVFHPTHRTEEEKRIRRNLRAKKQRALKKETK